MFKDPMPWFVAGPLIGLVVPALLLIGGKEFGVSANLRHLCALAGARPSLFRYEWRREGGWNLVFALGLIVGGAIAAGLPANAGSTMLDLAPATVSDLRRLGLDNLAGVAPPQLVSWEALTTLPGFVSMVVGGFLVGFGARWAGGCTSGHAIAGLSAMQGPSLLAVLAFFAGGLLVTHVVFPRLL